VVDTMTWLFHQAWQHADPLGEQGPDADDDGPWAEVERRLLRLLADGETDESAARQLALSVRSERRIIASLMDRLGAVSRFQAGHRASLRGWL
jgi:DNA-binding NarL/FixJ family response regulator